MVNLYKCSIFAKSETQFAKRDEREDRGLNLNAHRWQSVLGIGIASHNTSVVHDVAILGCTLIPTRECKHLLGACVFGNNACI